LIVVSLFYTTACIIVGPLATVTFVATFFLVTSHLSTKAFLKELQP
jgi:hypothetical protein